MSKLTLTLVSLTRSWYKEKVFKNIHLLLLCNDDVWRIKNVLFQHTMRALNIN